MRFPVLSCAVAGAALFFTQTAAAGPLDNLRARISGNEAYQAPSFAQEGGQRIRIFFGDGSFFNRYYGTDKEHTGYSFRDRSGLGLREAVNNWIGRMRNRERWGNGGLFGDGKMLQALGNVARIAGPIMTGAAMGLSGSAGRGSGYDWAGALRRAQSAYNVRKLN